MKFGIAGLGVGATQVLPQAEAAPFVEIVAAADTRPQARDEFQNRYEGKAYDSVAGLAADPDVEVAWVATPNPLHCEHTVTLLEHGKHVVVEKPMAVTLEQAERMVEAADRNGRQLMCGHTASLSPGFRAIRQVVASGRLGSLQAINLWSYNHWIFEPRMPDEIDMSKGGGQPYRQGPHQFDTVRLIGGGMVKSVRGSVRQWDHTRPTPGYYVAFLEFENGVPATVVKNGHGYFFASELLPWGSRSDADRRADEVRRSLHEHRPTGEIELKEADRFGGAGVQANGQTAPAAGGGNRSGFMGDAGLIVVSCERGDIRQSNGGLYIYDDDGIHDEPVTGGRRSELQELHEALTDSRPVPHDGRWGMATLEVILAMMESSRTGQEITLSHQVPSWE
jgi:phthalate 4,5-cis-dihydrodiol dehydrogenase